MTLFTVLPKIGSMIPNKGGKGANVGARNRRKILLPYDFRFNQSGRLRSVTAGVGTPQDFVLQLWRPMTAHVSKFAYHQPFVLIKSWNISQIESNFKVSQI